MGGGNLDSGAPIVGGDGLSPRGRGKHHPAYLATSYGRSIPAWAGETVKCLSFKLNIQVYPRVGGGNSSVNASLAASAGLSPRGRGKRGGFIIQRLWHRSIPAWAGETRSAMPSWSPQKVYPRVGGGNTPLTRPVSSAKGLSPRGRGKLEYALVAGELERSIPAWAGETVYTGFRIA